VKAEQRALLFVGHHLHAPTMGKGNLAGDIQAKAQALLRCRRQRPSERLEQLAQGLRGDGPPMVVNAEHEFAVGDHRRDRYRAVRVAVVQGIGDEVGEQLRYPLTVAQQAANVADVQHDLAQRMHALEFRGDMPEALGQVRAGLLVQGNAGTEATAGEVQYVTHQLRGASTTGVDVASDCTVLVIIQSLGQQFGTRSNGEQRVAQVMTQHGNELFAHFCHGPLLAQGALGALGVFLALDLDGQQAGERLHHWLDRAAPECCRGGIERTDGAKKAAIGTEHWY